MSDVSHEIRETLKLALPITFAQVAMMTMGLVDAALVGRVSETELAGVALGNALWFPALSIAMGITLAVEPLASQAFGAGEPRRAWASVRAGVWAVILISVPTMIAVAASLLLLEPFGVAAEVAPVARGFLLARLPGVVPFLVFLASKAYLEASGITRPILVGSWLANIVNLVAASVLVFGDKALTWVGLPAVGLPSLGALGAGLATSFSSLVLALIALVAAWRSRPAGATLRPEDPIDHGATTRKLLRVGVPIGFQLLTEMGVFAVASLLIGRLGAAATAAHQIALGLCSFTFMAVIGMGAATAVRVGRAIGAGEQLGARRAGLVGVGLTAIYMLGCALVFLVAATPLSALFTRQQDVIEIAAVLVSVGAVFQLADGVQGAAAGALRGAGDSKFASWANVVCHWFIGLPIGVYCCFRLGLGAKGMWWGLSTGLFVVAAVNLLRFLKLSSRKIEAL